MAGSGSPYPIGLRYGESAPTPSGIEHGTDVEVPDATPILSPVHGTVVFAGTFPSTGGTIGIYSAGHTYWFGHLKALQASLGDTVDAGNIIGLSGGAKGDWGRGDATGPHLWIGLSQGQQTGLNNLIDPLPFFDLSAVFSGAGGYSINPDLAKRLGIVSTAGGDVSTTKPWGTVHIPGDGDIPLGAYLKVLAGGVILIVALVLILVGSGVKSGAVGAAVERAPIVGPVVKRTRRASGERTRAKTINRREQQASEIREQRTAERTEARYRQATATRRAREGLNREGTGFVNE